MIYTLLNVPADDDMDASREVTIEAENEKVAMYCAYTIGAGYNLRRSDGTQTDYLGGRYLMDCSKYDNWFRGVFGCEDITSFQENHLAEIITCFETFTDPSCLRQQVNDALESLKG